MTRPPAIMIVDDEEAICRSMVFALQCAGFAKPTYLTDPRLVLDAMAANPIDLVLLDLNMPHGGGEGLMAKIPEKHPGMGMIVVTAVNDIATAVSCMKRGASDYLVKPVDRETLVSAVERALASREMVSENQRLRDALSDPSLRNPEAFATILTNSPLMANVFRYLEAIAGGTQPVLISGETGTGKELIAKALHTLSGRQGEFVAVNVAGMDDNLVSDTLFGHLKGAFTGADKDRPGLVRKAASGTLFLDEIGDLGPEGQVRLLRLIQEREYYPVGSDAPHRSDARIITASLHDLEGRMKEGKFRQDLFYRLKQHHVVLPPLRERPEDLPLLVGHFCSMAAKDLGVEEPFVPQEIFDLLGHYNFPGNIRELQAMIMDAAGRLRGNTLSLETFKCALEASDSDSTKQAFAEDFLRELKRLPPLALAKSMLIKEALRRANGNQSVAARLLGVTRQTIAKNLESDESPL